MYKRAKQMYNNETRLIKFHRLFTYFRVLIYLECLLPLKISRFIVLFIDAFSILTSNLLMYVYLYIVCFGGILAYASHCMLDSSDYNRPVAGYINICPSVRYFDVFVCNIIMSMVENMC